MRAGILFGLLTLMLSGCGESGGAGKATVKAPMPDLEFIKIDGKNNAFSIKNVGDAKASLQGHYVAFGSAKDLKIRSVINLTGAPDLAAGQVMSVGGKESDSTFKKKRNIEVMSGAGDKGALAFLAGPADYGIAILDSVQFGIDPTKKRRVQNTLSAGSQFTYAPKTVSKKLQALNPGGFTIPDDCELAFVNANKYPIEEKSEGNWVQSL